MNKHSKLIACILCIVVLLSACTSKKTNEGENPSGSKNNSSGAKNKQQANLDVLQPAAYGNVEGLNLEPGSYISLIGRSSDGAFWKMLENGAKQAIDDINKMLGYEGDDKVKFSFNAPSTNDSVDDQVNLLDEELALYPTAIGISAVDYTACEVQFDLAAENGIPIIAFESGSEYDGIQSMITTNNTEASQTAANKLSQSIDDEGEILLFVHDTFSTSAIDRANAITKEIKDEHPNVTIAGTYYMDNLTEVKQAIADKQGKTASGDEGAPSDNTAAIDNISDKEAISYILEQHPKASGCITTDASTTQVLLESLKTAKNTSMQVVGFEGSSAQLDALKKGNLSGLIVQNPYGMGYAAIVAAARAALSQGNEATVDCGYVWVTKDNMDTENIKRMLY